MRIALIAALLLALLAPVAALAQPRTLTVAATTALVTWNDTGGCVYHVEPGGARRRLGCSHTPRWEVPAGVLAAGEVVEVRRPFSAWTARGRAIVQP